MAQETPCSAEAQEEGRPVIPRAARLRPSQEGDMVRPGLARREGRVQARGRPSGRRLGHAVRDPGPWGQGWWPLLCSSAHTQPLPAKPAKPQTPQPQGDTRGVPAAHACGSGPALLSSVSFPKSGSPGPTPRSSSPSKSSQNQIISVTSVHWATASRSHPASPGRTLISTP